MTLRLHAPLRATCAALVSAALPAAVFAHSGDHGSDWLQAVMHLLSEPDHLAAAALAGVVAVWIARAFIRRGWRNTLPPRNRE